MSDVASVNWRETAEAELREGETLVGVLPALSPPPDAGAGGLVPPFLIPIIRAAEGWHWRRATRRRATTSRFPLAPRMIVALTDTRLLVWQARWRWRVGAFLGYVTLDRVVQADAPTVGAGWRTVRIFLANEPTVTLKVPAKVADDFAESIGS
jgi:hypothetical protein